MYTITTSMNNLIRCMNRYRTEQLAPLELKSCHAGYLLAICACPGITQEQLSRRIYANKSNVARQLAVLEESGYVLRQPGEADRRVMRVYPTEKAPDPGHYGRLGIGGGGGIVGGRARAPDGAAGGDDPPGGGTVGGAAGWED